MPTETDADQTNWLETETPDDWVSTTHERVYFRNRSDFNLYSDDLLEGSVAIAESVPENWTVVITAGPYRARDVSYDVACDERLIHVDFYSVRPGYCYLDDVIDDVQQIVSDASADEPEISA